MIVRISEDRHPCYTSLPPVPLPSKRIYTRLDLSSDSFVFRQLRLQHKHTVAYRITGESIVLFILTAKTINTIVVILILKYPELKLKSLLLRFGRKPFQQLNKVNFSAHLIRCCRRLITTFLQLYCRTLQLQYQCCQQQIWLRLLVTIIIILQSGLHQNVALNVCLLLLFHSLNLTIKTVKH